MSRSFIIIGFIAVCFLAGCKTEEEWNVPAPGRGKETAAASGREVVKGCIRVKLTPAAGDAFAVTRSGAQLSVNEPELDAYLRAIGATDMRRVFPYAGKFEERTRREGLHRWYEIRFDESLPVTRVSGEVRMIPGVECVEEVLAPALPPVRASALETDATRADGELPFDDPMLSAQWHYHNTGSVFNAVPGADINLFPAWKKQTGKPAVVVAVVDGGIDVNHEDLKENLWSNVAERDGAPGVDDDGNGFVDDVHGYDFMWRSGNIRPVLHGTHVAGTIAARNNNGLGVAGVAGGDGTPGSGVRLMSCQVFDQYSGVGPALAIKYGADNGAVICQNSWGFQYPGPTEIPADLKDAIDYFIKYAGCDNAGNQLPGSPMKGGVVIFAAGNDNREDLSFPAAYPPVVSVSSIRPDFKRARYSNFGQWVSVAAPGGDLYYFAQAGGVLSTLPGNQYGYLEGTSMACPHVSGIAALAVSQFGGPGFTCDSLRRLLVTAVGPESIDARNPDFAGKLGAGFIDADRVLSVNGHQAPGKIAGVQIDADYTTLTLKWLAVSDADDGTPARYRVYWSEETLTAANYRDAACITLNGFVYAPGTEVRCTLPNLPLKTAYSFAIVAEDRWGLKTDPVFCSGRTNENFPPKLTRSGAEKVHVTGSESAEVQVAVGEPDGQAWTWRVSGEQRGVSVERSGDALRLRFRAVAAPGNYRLQVEVSDVFYASATLEIPFEVYENHPPRLEKPFEKVFLPIGGQDRILHLSEYFSDEDGHALTFAVRSTDESAVSASLSGDALAFHPLKLGLGAFEITAEDSQGALTRAAVQVQVARDELVYAVYPVPADEDLNVRLSDRVEQADISIFTTTGNRVYFRSVGASGPGGRLVTLDVSKLSGGTYVLQAAAGGETFRQPFIKR